MPRSHRTLQLNQTAHELGDEYYRCATVVARSSGDLQLCIDMGQGYLAALEELHKHLLSLPFDREVDILMQTTEGHMGIVRKELVRLEAELT